MKYFAPILLLFVIACAEEKLPPPTVALHEAVYTGNMGQVKAHIQHGSDINKEGPINQLLGGKEFPICIAAKMGHLEIAKLLLDHGADPNAMITQPALHYAIEEKNTDIAKLLIEYNANINVLSRNEKALHIATERELSDIIQILIDKKADIHEENGFGKSSLDIAMRSENQEIINIFLDSLSPEKSNELKTTINVKQVSTGIRSLKVSLECFFIDNNQYMWMSKDPKILSRQYPELSTQDPSIWTIDKAHVLIGTDRTGMRLFLTTPVSYISAIPYDPFRTSEGKYSYGYGSDGNSYYVITSWGPDGVDGLGPDAPFRELEYTGARLTDNKAAFRGSKLKFRDYQYNPSNGLLSAGDIISVGP